MVQCEGGEGDATTCDEIECYRIKRNIIKCDLPEGNSVKCAIIKCGNIKYDILDFETIISGSTKSVKFGSFEGKPTQGEAIEFDTVKYVIVECDTFNRGVSRFQRVKCNALKYGILPALPLLHCWRGIR